ncbi:ATP-grasp domain-containing protein [Ruminococcus sp. AF18-22]|nr:ATP-grasp domain-containing protein [Ruminococcus sp. AF18-22]
MQEKIMILGAGRGQVDLIRSAKKLGYTTVVTSIEGNYPGFELADEICYADISNPEEVADAAEKYGVQGIATACLDTGIAALGYSCEKLGLTGLSERSAKLSGDKLLMKSAFMDAGVQTARYKKVSSREDVINVLEELELPMIVKAVDLQGSRGINIAYDREELLDGYDRTMKETKKDFCIIEEFIDGYEFGAQAFVLNNEVLFVLPCGDITYLGHTKIPVGHYAPLDFEDEVLEKIDKQVRKAIQAIGLNNCAVNIDMILRGDEVYVIELTGRIGANCLPQITSIFYGIDIYRLIVETAMGKDPSGYFRTERKDMTASYAKMLISEKSGKLKRIINTNDKNSDIEEITFFVKEGDMINKFTNSRDCIGQIVVKGKNLAKCETLIDEVIKNISFELE